MSLAYAAEVKVVHLLSIWTDFVSLKLNYG